MGHHHHEHHRRHRDFDHNDDHYRAYQQYEGSHHKAKLSHELISAALAYQAAKAYNEHCAKNGHPGTHDKAKEVFAAFAGFYLDRMIETKGLDMIDRHRALNAVREHGDGHFGGYY